jgi:hypothetical protein
MGVDYAEFPQHVHLRASVRREGVRERNHAATVRFCDFADIMLDHLGSPIISTLIDIRRMLSVNFAPAAM